MQDPAGYVLKIENGHR